MFFRMKADMSLSKRQHYETQYIVIRSGSTLGALDSAVPSAPSNVPGIK